MSFKIEAPDFALGVVDMLADGTLGIALLLVGAVLADLRSSGSCLAEPPERRGIFWLVMCCKLGAHPLVMLTIGATLDLPDEQVLAAIIFSAAPMLTVFPALSAPYAIGPLAGRILFFCVAASIVTISLWISVVDFLGYR